MQLTVPFSPSWDTLVWVLIAIILVLGASLVDLGGMFGRALLAFTGRRPKKSRLPLILLGLAVVALLISIYTVFT
jgi:hypothetical protein